jgi:hypothetical protein
LNGETPQPDNLIQFPQRLRVMPIGRSERSTLSLKVTPALIEHSGRMYDLAPLIQQLSPQEVYEITATAPRSGQELWDEVIRRWPVLAAEIVAGARPAE